MGSVILLRDTLANPYRLLQLSTLDQIERRVLDGPHESGIREFLIPHVDLIFRCACRLTRKSHDAEDLTQETFYYAIKNFQQLKDRDKAKNWLFSILKNLFLKDLEKSKRKIDINFDLVSNTISSFSNVEEEHLKVEIARNLRDVLDKLDDRLKVPIEMFYFERKSYKEIACSLNVPIGTVMSRIARGKVTIRRELGRSGHLKV